MASYFRQVPNFEYINRNADGKTIPNYIPVKNLFKRGNLRQDIFGNLSYFEKYSIIGDDRPDNVAYKFYGDETLDWIILLSNNILNVQTEWPMTQATFDKVMLEKYGTYENLYSNIHHYETIEIKNSAGVTVLQGGTKMPNTWRTNGNFITTINTKINRISSGDSIKPSKIVTVYTANPISSLEVGTQITINNVTESQYNGNHVITEILPPNGFRFELPFVPRVALPTLADPIVEEVLLTIPETSSISSSTILPSSCYYEFYDEGLGYNVTLSSSNILTPITNYEYEKNLEEEKRNIYVLKARYLNIVFNDMDSIMPYKKGSQQYVSENLKRGDNARLYE